MPGSPFPTQNYTDSTATTVYLSEGNWNGSKVWVESDRACEIPGHALAAMHHYGPDGKDYGPTGFLWCDECLGIADEPESLS